MENLNKKKILIFGGLGLIGSNIARNCISQGSLVTIAGHHSPKYGANDFNLKDLKDRFQLVVGDIRNKNFVESLVKGQDIIFNCAAQVNHNLSIENPILDNQLNCIGHINVLMACKNNNKDALLVYPGSRLQYGKISQLPVTESHPLEPLSIYAIHKNTGEQYYRAFYKHYGIHSICFRITNPYGPGGQMKNPGQGIVNWFVRQAIDNQTINIYGDGKQIRDYIYIDDLIEGILSAVKNPGCYGKVYNLGTGQPTSFIDMAKTIIEVVGSGRIQNVPWPKNYDHFETGDFYADISKIKKETKWEPRTNLKDGIKKTYEFYKKYQKYYW